jgi:hypothetical protein
VGSPSGGFTGHVLAGRADHPRLGCDRPDLSLQRHLAAGYQHGYHGCYLPDVFLIQNTQNRDALAIHIKLDELIRAMHGARNRMVDLEDLSVEELDALKTSFASLAQDARQKLSEES